MTLSLARQLHASGHQVYVADSERHHFCRYSRAVHGVIQTTSSMHDPESYIANIVEAVRFHHIDLVIPGWEEVMLLARFRRYFPKQCRIFAPDYELLHSLHHKGLFMELIAGLGFAVPNYRIVHAGEECDATADHPLALKACYSRSSREVYCVHQGARWPQIRPTSEHPWLAQEWIHGPIHCSYSVCESGRLVAHAVYPMEFVRRVRATGKGNAGSYCLSYVACEHPGIEAWTKEFVAKTGYTGQLAFDFVERPSDGQLFAIDCNPRMTHGVSLFHAKDGLSRAFCGWEGEILRPRRGAARQLFMANLTMGWRLAVRAGRLGLYLRRLFSCSDIVFMLRDLGPVFFQAIAACKLLRLRLQLGVPSASAFTADIDFNGLTDPSHKAESCDVTEGVRGDKEAQGPERQRA